jgi:hypothetical protein
MNDGGDDDDAAHVPPSLPSFLPSFLPALPFWFASFGFCFAWPSFPLPKSSFDAAPREWHAHGEDVMACHGPPRMDDDHSTG